MADIELVIKIREEIYQESIKSSYSHLYDEEVANAVANGKQLPKGHGDLKDMNDLCYKSRYGCKGNCEYLHTCNSYGAPTIIKADKESDISGKTNSDS